MNFQKLALRCRWVAVGLALALGAYPGFAESEITPIAQHPKFTARSCRSEFEKGIRRLADAEVIPFHRPRVDLVNGATLEGRQLAYIRGLLDVKQTEFGVWVPRTLQKRIELIYRSLSESARKDFVAELVQITDAKINELLAYSLEQIQDMSKYREPPPYFDFSKIDHYEKIYQEGPGEMVTGYGLFDGYYHSDFDLNFASAPPDQWHRIIRDQVRSRLPLANWDGSHD